MINFFITNFSAHIDWAIFLIAMIPTLECRISIPFGFSFSNFNAMRILFLSFLGSITPSIFIILITKLIKSRVSKINIYSQLIKKYEKKIKKLNEKSSLLKKLGYLFTFVAIPLPLTGVWSGSLIAGLTDLPIYPSFLAISLGSLVASSIMLICSQFFGSSVIYLLFISLIMILIVGLITLIKKIKRK